MKTLFKEAFVTDSLEEIASTASKCIYLKRNISKHLIVPFDNIYGIICDVQDTTPNESGIPEELIRRVDMNHFSPKFKSAKNRKVIYYSDEFYDSPIQVLRIIQLFNQLPSVNLEIYAADSIRNKLVDFCNANIEFHLGQIAEGPKEVSLMITHGYAARKFIAQKIPTLIIGPKGMGGWVSPDNLKQLFEHNFSGRPNGSPDETLPLGILADEIMSIEQCRDLDTLLEKCKNSLQVMLAKMKHYSLQYAIEDLQSLKDRLEDKEDRNLLYPQLASNVSVIQSEDQLLFQRTTIHDLLFALPFDDWTFSEDLKQGQLNCSELQQKYQMDDQAFWEVLIPLWQRKAVIFKHEIPKEKRAFRVL